jgi:hypothetical protein
LSIAGQIIPPEASWDNARRMNSRPHLTGRPAATGTIEGRFCKRYTWNSGALYVECAERGFDNPLGAILDLLRLLGICGHASVPDLVGRFDLLGQRFSDRQ